MDGGERSVIVDVGELTDDQIKAMGAIERMAANANLGLDRVAALLSLKGMGERTGTVVAPKSRRNSA